MTETLRDRLAAVLGPGNDDTTAYTQADAVLEIAAAYAGEIAVEKAKEYREAWWQSGYRRGHDAALGLEP